jgi:hypothetical protein
MTSVTTRARSTLCEGYVSGSMSCEAADGGGHTPSWNMEPDSEARVRSRRNEVEGGWRGGANSETCCGGEFGEGDWDWEEREEERRM